MRKTVSFKSIPENWEKERDGRKPNTLRKKDLEDPRHLALGAMMVSGDYGRIRIENSETGKAFDRQITDVTEWQGWLIISWDPHSQRR
jgi:hypothetical protein